MIYAKLDTILGNKIKTHDIRIISGCAAGPDTIGARWAYERGLPVDKVPADWEKFGKSAGMTFTLAWELAYRNDEMFGDMSPEERHAAFVRWIDKQLGAPANA